MRNPISSKLKTARSLYTQMKVRADAGHKSTSAQAMEMARMAVGPQKVHPQEYIELGLSNPDVYDNPALHTFVGNHMQKKVSHDLNAIYWEGVETDKILMAMAFDKFGIRTTRTQAAICLYHRSAGEMPVLRSPEQILDFFRRTAKYPVFVKPIKGGFSRGSFRAEHYHADTDEFELLSGERLDVRKCLHDLEDKTGYGFVVQEAVDGVQETAAVSGKIPTGLRIVTLLGDDESRIYRVTWKIPTGSNHADNFSGGRMGNLCCGVDESTGEVSRVLGGSEAGLVMLGKESDAGARLLGSQVPFWNEIHSFVLQATSAFSGFRCQHWDIGITSIGIVAYEVNARGRWDLTQAANGRGIMEPPFTDFLAKHSDSGRRNHLGFKPIV